MANIIQINGKKVKDVNAARMSSLAPVESSTTASMAHAVGDYFWLNGTLYEATAAITVGNAISVGTNCKITNMGENLADLKSQMSAVDSMALGAYPTDTASGAVASFSDGADSIPVKDLVIAIEPIQSGSGDPSPDNVRPISGWTGANVTRTGENLWDEEWELGSYNNTTGERNNITDRIRCKNMIRICGGHIYCLPFLMNFSFYNANRDIIPGVTVSGFSTSGNTYLRQSGNTNGFFTAPQNAKYLKFYMSQSYGTTYKNDISINMDISDTAYHSYVGTTIPITFPSEAGTVYGGTLDVTTGVLTVDRVKVAPTTVYSINTHQSTGLKYWMVLHGINSINTRTSNIYLYKSNIFRPNTGVYYGSYYVTSNGANLSVVPYQDQQSIDDVNQAGAWLAENQAEFVYPLATPQTYQLTPIEILTLLGANTIYADTGDVLSLTYRADPTLYADKRSNATRSIIAGIEPTMTASKAYTVGQLLIVGDTLYKVAASIASGATLTPGTNVNPTTVAEQLILLANA